MLRRLTRHAAAAAVLLTAAACAGDTAEDTAVPDTANAAPGDVAAPFAIADVGFQTPESVLYDEQADVYLVSNINGEPLGRDDNGFISRVRPDGTVDQLKWIDGAAEGVTLNAPKGMAVIGDTLFVADIDSVRAFHRNTGASLNARGVSGASFLNDLAAGDDGTLYVTDTGVDATFAGTGTDAIHAFGGSGAASIASGAALQNPNGIVAAGAAILMVPFGGNAVWSVTTAAGGTPTQHAQLPAGQLDGIVRLSDGTLLVSSWEGQAVYRVSPAGEVTVVADSLEAPADIGWDVRRNRVLIPLFNANRVEVRAVR